MLEQPLVLDTRLKLELDAGRRFWLVGAYWGEEEGDQSTRFIRDGNWENGYEDKFLDQVRQVAVGDRVAIKAAYVRYKDLPFDSQGKGIGCMIIKARGIVTENPGDGRSLTVDWEPDFEPHDMVKFSYQPTINEINPTKFQPQIAEIFFDGPPAWQVAMGTVAAAPAPEPTPLPPVYTPINRIYYGPPGTGKTYRWRSIAADYEATDAPGLEPACEMVTFHQSFGYEEFVEGLRAEVVGTAVQYRVQPGIFKRMCQRAHKEPFRRFALFIDEINRGNVSRIFGELITLIEADKRVQPAAPGQVVDAPPGSEVVLPYSGERFTVPANLDLYGSMNTADRSLAQLDAALRRRFEFSEITPDTGLLAGVVVEGVEVDKLLKAINWRIEALFDRDHLIGHAYFMGLVGKAHPTLAEDLAPIFSDRLLPLLEDYFFSDWQKIRLVLADPAKAPEDQFVVSRNVGAVQLLFGADGDAFFPGIDELQRFERNDDALLRPTAYQAVYQGLPL